MLFSGKDRVVHPFSCYQKTKNNISKTRHLTRKKPDPKTWLQYYNALIVEKQFQLLFEYLFMLSDGTYKIEYDAKSTDDNVGGSFVPILNISIPEPEIPEHFLMFLQLEASKSFKFVLVNA